MSDSLKCSMALAHVASVTQSSAYRSSTIWRIDLLGVGPRALVDRAGREVDLRVAEAGVAAEQRVLAELVDRLAVPAHPQHGDLDLPAGQVAAEQHGLGERAERLRQGAVVGHRRRDVDGVDRLALHRLAGLRRRPSRSAATRGVVGRAMCIWIPLRRRPAMVAAAAAR